MINCGEKIIGRFCVFDAFDQLTTVTSIDCMNLHKINDNLLKFSGTIEQLLQMNRFHMGQIWSKNTMGKAQLN